VFFFELDREGGGWREEKAEADVQAQRRWGTAASADERRLSLSSGDLTTPFRPWYRHAAEKKGSEVWVQHGVWSFGKLRPGTSRWIRRCGVV
jgi:hypothetical protein